MSLNFSSTADWTFLGHKGRTTIGFFCREMFYDDIQCATERRFEDVFSAQLEEFYATVGKNQIFYWDGGNGLFGYLLNSGLIHFDSIDLSVSGIERFFTSDIDSEIREFRALFHYLNFQISHAVMNRKTSFSITDTHVFELTGEHCMMAWWWLVQLIKKAHICWGSFKDVGHLLTLDADLEDVSFYSEERLRNMLQTDWKNQHWWLSGYGPVDATYGDGPNREVAPQIIDYWKSVQAQLV